MISCRVQDLGDFDVRVVDRKIGNFYAVLVASSALLQEGYIIPAQAIIDDIERVINDKKIDLPTTTDNLRLAAESGNVDLISLLNALGARVSYGGPFHLHECVLAVFSGRLTEDEMLEWDKADSRRDHSVSQWMGEWDMNREIAGNGG